MVYNFLPVKAPFLDGVQQPIIGVDYKAVFRPSAISVILGNSPYNGWAYNPPWIFLALLPVAVFPESIGSAIMFVLNLASVCFVSYKLGANKWVTAAIMFSPPVISTSINGNIDGLLSLGFILPPQIGLFLVLAKPQIGIGVALFWAVQAYKEHGFSHVVRIFLPVTVAFTASFVVYGFWPLSTISPFEHPWNVSVWPWGIPIGISLLFVSIKYKSLPLSISAAPFLSPYLSLLSWSAFLLGVSRWKKIALLFVLLAWAYSITSGHIFWMMLRLGLF